MKSLVPFLAIGTLVVAMGGGAGLKHTDPPINYNTQPHDGIIRPYNPVPQLPKAIAAPAPTPAPGSCPDYGEYNGTVLAQMVCEMRYHGGLSETTLNQARQSIQACEAQRQRVCN